MPSGTGKVFGLGRVPLIRGLGLREVVGVKAVRSAWDTRHETVTAMPSTTTGLDGWYERRVGVENIFNVLRLDLHLESIPSAPGMLDPWGWRVGLGFEL